MDRQAQIRDFLMSRRARISPEQAGLPTYDGLRRVAGLRREEVAHAAAISVDYYTRLERGRVSGASRDVLASIARTLQLDDPEREYLFSLFQNTPSPNSIGRSRARGARTKIRPALQLLLDNLDIPAFVTNARGDIVATNHAGKALYSWLGDDFRLPFSIPRFIFLDPRAREFYLEWGLMARTTVALLRSQTGGDPDNEHLLTLIGHLATRSAEFRELWAAHHVRRHREAAKRFNHPTVGTLEFLSESLDISQDPDHSLVAFTVAPNSPTAEAMAWLASWTITPTQVPERGLDLKIDEPGDRSRPI